MLQSSILAISLEFCFSCLIRIDWGDLAWILFWVCRNRLGCLRLILFFFTCTRPDWDVLAWILFWVFSSKRLGCPRRNFVLSLYRTTGVSLLEFCFEFVRSDWGVLAWIVFEVCEKRLGCPRWSFVLSLRKWLGCPLLMSSVSSLCEATVMSLLQLRSRLFFSPFQATGVSGLKFYFLFLFQATGGLLA